MFDRYEDIVTVDELMEMLLIGRNTAYYNKIITIRLGIRARLMPGSFLSRA